MGNLKVLVTGGAGFMGSDMVRFLVGRDECSRITVLDNFSYASDPERLSELDGLVRIVQGDIRDEVKVGELVRDADIVLNFAAETHNDNSLSRPLDFISTNINGVATLLEACRSHDAHFHQVSTDEVFGDLPLDSQAKFTESSNLAPSSPYSSSKASAELLVLSWIRSFSVSATISNSANNFGEMQHSEKLIPQLFSSAQARKPARLYGSGQNKRDWLYVRDHSRAVWEIASKPEKRSSIRYIVSASQVYSNIEVAGAVNRSFGLPEGYIELVEDRPGHDLMYASSNELLTKDFNWKPEGPSLQEWVKTESLRLIQE